MANRGDGRLHTEVTLAEFICLMLFLLSRSQSGPWGRRQAELCPQLRPHHRKTGERLIVKSVLQKLFRFFLKLQGFAEFVFFCFGRGAPSREGACRESAFAKGNPLRPEGGAAPLWQSRLSVLSGANVLTIEI